MVKGVTRRVIVVRSPDPRLFEEAIFIVKEDIVSKNGINSKELLREAQNVANGYIESHLSKPPKVKKFPPWVFVGLGSLISGIAFWLLTYVI